jgi:hypothetical protein
MTDTQYFGNPINGAQPLVNRTYYKFDEKTLNLYESLLENGILAKEDLPNGRFNLRFTSGQYKVEDIEAALNGEGPLSAFSISQDPSLESRISKSETSGNLILDVLPNKRYAGNDNETRVVQGLGEYLVKAFAIGIHPEGWKAIGAYLREKREDIIAQGNFRQLNQALAALQTYQNTPLFMEYLSEELAKMNLTSFNQMSVPQKLELIYTFAGKINATHKKIQTYESIENRNADFRAGKYAEAGRIKTTRETNLMIAEATKGLDEANAEYRKGISARNEVDRLKAAEIAGKVGNVGYLISMSTSELLTGTVIGLVDGVVQAINSVKNRREISTSN